MTPEILNAISSVGFPIIACAYMAVTNTKLTEKLSELVSQTAVAIDNNAQAMSKLSEAIESLKEDKE